MGPAASSHRLRVLVVHGPNLDLLGRRAPHIYGRTSLSEIDRSLRKRAAELGASVAIKQSNHEGDLITWVGHANEKFDGVLINPAACSHTSVGLADAIEACGLPAVEVHLTNTSAREKFRAHSFSAAKCIAVVQGFGSRSYLLGFEGLIAYLTENHGNRPEATPGVDEGTKAVRAHRDRDRKGRRED